MGELGWGYFVLLAKRKEKWVEAWKDSFVPTYHFLQASKSEYPHPFPHQNKGFNNLQFSQEMSSQKPCWDQARLSSQVNIGHLKCDN